MFLGGWTRPAKVVPGWGILGSELPWWTSNSQPGRILQQSHVYAVYSLSTFSSSVLANCIICVLPAVMILVAYYLNTMQKLGIKRSNSHSSQERGIILFFIFYLVSFYTIVCTIILLLCQAEVLLGSPMTYSLFEYAKENAEDLVTVTESQPQEQEQVWWSGFFYKFFEEGEDRSIGTP